MTTDGLLAAQQKMADAGVPQTAIDVFSDFYGQLAGGGTGMIGEDAIEAVTDLDRLDDQQIDAKAADEALAQTVIIKLNGGLGTSMGMTQAKSLLPVRDGKTFLDLIVEQVFTAREQHGVRLPLVLMNSFRTQADSLAALEKYAGLPVDGLPLDFLQNQEPKLLEDSLSPVEWPADPTLEWCPPGHGDIYTALATSGVLKALLDAGFRYASVSNSDNLGAVPSAELAGWFAGTGAPFAMEVCRRTKADRKGGHLARRREDNQLILREVAQTAEEDLQFFTDEDRHRYFNTNSLWFDLQQLAAVLEDRGGVLGLPLIRNKKNVDPTDASSPKVYQIESAMGAAIEVFEGATAIEVGRNRFLPVKTTNDLLLLRSDTYRVLESGALELVPAEPCHVELDSKFYKKIADFEKRFPQGAPSLVEATDLAVKGDWTFGADVKVVGKAELADAGGPQTVADGSKLGE